MKKFIFALIIIFLLAPSINAATMPGDVLVIFKNPSENEVNSASLASDGEHMAYLASAASELDAEVSLTYDELSESSNEIFALIHSDTKSEQELLKEILARPDVKGAQLNYILRAASTTPNDRYYRVYPDSNGLLWGMKATRANEVWDKTTGSDSVYVAVIDSGIDTTHPDIKDNVAKNYCRAYEENNNDIYYSDREAYYQDDAGHGTHVSGVIGAVGNNGEGIAGVNWETKIIAFKILDKDGAGSVARCVAALQDVIRLARQGVNIIAVNMSLGTWASVTPTVTSNESEPFWLVMKMVSDLDIILCVAAGNEDQAIGVPAPCDEPEPSKSSNGEPVYAYKKGDYCYPASFLNISNMIVVASASQDVTGKIIRSAEGFGESHSNYSGEYVDIAAPGSHIVSSVPSDYEPVSVLDMTLVELFEKSQDIIAEHPSIEEQMQKVCAQLVERGVNNYARFAGTSMATPYVVGAAALLKSAYPDATGSQIKKAILEGANKNYCASDQYEVSYKIPANHTIGNTSKYGFLDIQSAYDLLPTIIAEDSKSSGGSSGGGGGGCNLIRSENLEIRNLLLIIGSLILVFSLLKIKFK